MPLFNNQLKTILFDLILVLATALDDWLVKWACCDVGEDDKMIVSKDHRSKQGLDKECNERGGSSS